VVRTPAFHAGDRRFESGWGYSSSLQTSGPIDRTALKPSRYRVTITGTDTAGNRSKGTRPSFMIIRP